MEYESLKEEKSVPTVPSMGGIQPDKEIEIHIRRLANGYLVTKYSMAPGHKENQYLFTSESKIIGHITQHIKELEEEIRIKKLEE